MGTVTVIVYVHGLWLSGVEAVLLRRRLARALDAETRAFAYPSVRADVTQNARALRRYLEQIRADTLHLVAHSMGGSVVLRAFETAAAAPDGGRLPPGRVVFAGTPVRGSRSAERFARWPNGRAMLGYTAADVLLGRREPRWPAAERDLGIIAGNFGAGLGRLLGPMRAPNDGTVLVEETELAGATDRLCLPVSHSGMMFSAAVARQVTAFLRDGRFERRGD
jgi:pimeloyl-ACP methyl ester carboxylesterase